MSGQMGTGAYRGLTPVKLFWAVFWSTILVLAGLWLYAYLHHPRVSENAQGQPIVSEAFVDDLKRALPGALADMKLTLSDAERAIAVVVNDEVDAAFALALARLPAFLDFHYSIIGEYTELAAPFLEDGTADLKRLLFEESGLSERLEAGLASIDKKGNAIIGKGKRSAADSVAVVRRNG